MMSLPILYDVFIPKHDLPRLFGLPPEVKLVDRNDPEMQERLGSAQKILLM